jgi:asparagine synthase (glutamine-hydrolysing)
MAEGVEVRVPFLDDDLLEFAATIPSPLKQQGATGKWILKKAMEPLLPRDIVYRPKTGFGLPLRRWLRNELKDFAAEALSRQSIEGRGLFDFRAVEQLLADDEAGRLDGTYAIFALICIELWMREFTDVSQGHDKRQPSHSRKPEQTT